MATFFSFFFFLTLFTVPSPHHPSLRGEGVKNWKANLFARRSPQRSSFRVGGLLSGGGLEQARLSKALGLQGGQTLALVGSSSVDGL